MSEGVTRNERAGQTAILSTIIALFMLFACAACSSVTRPSDSDLNGVVKMFHHDLRWKYFKSAAARVDPRFAADFLESLEEGEKDLNITEWEIRRMEPSRNGQRARVRVRLKYYKMPSTILEDETIEQIWEQRDGAWTLVSVDGGPFELEGESENSSTEPEGKGAEEKRHGTPDEKHQD